MLSEQNWYVIKKQTWQQYIKTITFIKDSTNQEHNLKDCFVLKVTGFKYISEKGVSLTLKSNVSFCCLLYQLYKYIILSIEAKW